MRLIGSLKTQQEAFNFQKFCQSKGIELLVDQSNQAGESTIQLWVVNEDETVKAVQFLEAYKKNPSHPEFYVISKEPLEQEDLDTSTPQVVAKAPRLPILTWGWIFLSVILFFIQMGQTSLMIKDQGSVMMEVELTPIEQKLFFDVPQGFTELKTFVETHQLKTHEDLEKMSEEDKKSWDELRRTAYFHGFLDMIEDPEYKKSYQDKKMPIFQKIKEGQVYRLITPVFLHGSLLHILFNMIWLFLLMKLIEMKLGVFKTLILAIVCGVVSNVAQYILTGPFFIGASGIIIGLAAFIWMRQKRAPWEGYALSRSLLFFLMIYVLALVVLSIGVFVFNLTSHKDLSFGVANAAHVFGGLTGLVLGSLKFFRRA
jgi:GlpG protein